MRCVGNDDGHRSPYNTVMYGDVCESARMSEAERWQILLDRLGALHEVIVPGVLLGAVRLINDLDLALTHLATLYVLRAQDGLAVNQIAETVGLSMSQASRVVDHLVDQGLVRRAEDERDRRAKLVSISPRAVNCCAPSSTTSRGRSSV